MIRPSDLQEWGELWWIARNLTGDAQNVPLVVTRDAVRVRSGAAGGPSSLHGDRIVILGIYYTFTAANGNGFDLVQRSYQVSPGLSGTDFNIYGARASTAITVVTQSLPDLCIPLEGPVSSPAFAGGTPFAGPADAADFVLTTTATGPTNGRILIIGTITSHESAVRAHNHRGSPFTGA